MPSKPAERSKMDCCTVVCQMGAAALLPLQLAAETPPKSDGVIHNRTQVKELASFAQSGLDPPPRLPS